MAAKAPKTICLRVSTLMLSLQLLCILVRFLVVRSGLRYTAVFTVVHMCRAHFTAVLPKIAVKAPKTNHLRVSTHMLPVHQLSRGFYSFLSSTEADCSICLGAYRSPPVSAAFTAVRPENGR